jgi:hypothetical protein
MVFLAFLAKVMSLRAGARRISFRVRKEMRPPAANSGLMGSRLKPPNFVTSAASHGMVMASRSGAL